MLVLCEKCGKVVGCVIGETSVVCNSEDCATARAYEMCQNYPDNKKIFILCAPCQEELKSKVVH